MLDEGANMFVSLRRRPPSVSVRLRSGWVPIVKHVAVDAIAAFSTPLTAVP